MRTSEVRPITGPGALAVRAAHALAASADIVTLQRILGLDRDEPGPAATGGGPVFTGARAAADDRAA
ncbi:hypothetical protein [Streptomyces fragilis]|uniref:Uncharacterized protein n=2 Tax=Streptomyces fragilis TaxID=67301 RepID=A0ABV2YHH1_9ACTN|nr:hypothetical protein [Streptomyces fragilis]